MHGLCRPVIVMAEPREAPKPRRRQASPAGSTGRRDAGKTAACDMKEAITMTKRLIPGLRKSWLALRDRWIKANAEAPCQVIGMYAFPIEATHYVSPHEFCGEVI